MINKFYSFLLLCIALLTSGCGTYSFTGASISPEVKTISISIFQNRAPLVQPTLSLRFTERLKDKFVGQTTLKLINTEGDLQFEGYISDYRVDPIAIQGTQTAALNRLTISVNVKFTNLKDPKNDFESVFSRYADYDSKLSLISIESGLIDDINRQLVDDIFNKSVSNW
jgi:hypothetical protein